MATARLLRSSSALRYSLPSRTSASSISTVKCISIKAGLGGQKAAAGWDGGDKSKTSSVALKASVATSESLIITADPAGVDRGGGLNIPSMITTLCNALLKILKTPVKHKPWKFQAQMFIQKFIVDCRFFTLFAVAGSLLGSILCFVEGCFLILESYLQYFNGLSRSLDQALITKLLIEAIDVFLMGTAMLIFGVGLYVMFVGSKNPRDERPWPRGSNFFGLFYLQSLPTWVEMQSISKAKSKMGHAVMMILQLRLLEKFKDVPLITSLDLACLAGAVLVSSASAFLLSRISVDGSVEDT